MDHPISPELADEGTGMTSELPYKSALYEIYTVKLGKKINDQNMKQEAPRNIASHFDRQQRDFNDAAWYEHSLRDTVADFDNQFSLLKKDAYDGIEETYYNDEYGNNGMKRLREVQNKIITITLDLSNLKNIDNILSNNIKKGHFDRQQRDFNDAAWYEHSLRDTVADFDNQFSLLKKDAYDGIEETYYNDEYGNNGMKRLREVQNKIITITLDLSNLKNIDNILSNNIKKGLCHLMVNDKLIKSWVDINED